MARTGYDFQSLTQENRDWKEARAMSKEIIQFDQAMFETKLDAMVRDKVEQIADAMLDEEADLIANAARYERSDGRKAYRAGHYGRGFTVKAGRLGLKVPKLKGALFESAVIERYRQRARPLLRKTSGTTRQHHGGLLFTVPTPVTPGTNHQRHQYQTRLLFSSASNKTSIVPADNGDIHVEHDYLPTVQDFVCNRRSADW